MDKRDFADMDNADLDRHLDLDGEESVCINEHCEFYDFMAHQNCGGDCDGEPAIASCEHSQTTEPPDTVASLRIRLATAEQERDEFKDIANSVGILHVTLSKMQQENIDLRAELSEAKAGWEAADAQISIEAGDVMRLTKERDELRVFLDAEREWSQKKESQLKTAQEDNERLKDQVTNIDGTRAKWLECALERQDQINQLESALTAAQQSTKEQLRAGMERAAVIADIAAGVAEAVGKMHHENTDSRDRCFARYRQAAELATAIREAAKEQGWEGNR